MALRDMGIIGAAEAAEILGVSKVRVAQLCQRGQLDAVKVGGSWVMTRESVEGRAVAAPTGGRPRGPRVTGRFRLHGDVVAEVVDDGDGSYPYLRYADGETEVISTAVPVQVACHIGRSPYDLEYREVRPRSM